MRYLARFFGVSLSLASGCLFTGETPFTLSIPSHATLNDISEDGSHRVVGAFSDGLRIYNDGELVGERAIGPVD